ncbi:hypothetical protein F7725_004896 [Dissostichus mawsoni]|uniref:Uncharacterized protein n=1 Tax=Dissostichus mawsoni TaxID=36200 RepID=A0A7J5XK25_DISMA|nr:hypothetical protein F7725_004896 [Dissostichus mawsoni]
MSSPDLFPFTACCSPRSGSGDRLSSLGKCNLHENSLKETTGNLFLQKRLYIIYPRNGCCLQGGKVDFVPLRVNGAS